MQLIFWYGHLHISVQIKLNMSFNIFLCELVFWFIEKHWNRSGALNNVFGCCNIALEL
jgi:hypothetical protein